MTAVTPASGDLRHEMAGVVRAMLRRPGEAMSMDIVDALFIGPLGDLNYEIQQEICGLKEDLAAARAEASAERARADRLEAALRPFATYAECMSGGDFGHGEIGEYYHEGVRVSIRTQVLDAARTALTRTETSPESKGGSRHADS